MKLTNEVLVAIGAWRSDEWKMIIETVRRIKAEDSTGGVRPTLRRIDYKIMRRWAEHAEFMARIGR